jgi:peptide deformylase
VRPHFLEVRGLDALGCPFERAFQGFNAVLVHHEIDHLDGVLFIDRIEHPDDLYRVRQEEDSSLVRVPITPNLKRELRL